MVIFPNFIHLSKLIFYRTVKIGLEIAGGMILIVAGVWMLGKNESIELDPDAAEDDRIVEGLCEENLEA